MFYFCQLNALSTPHTATASTPGHCSNSSCTKGTVATRKGHCRCRQPCWCHFQGTILRLLNRNVHWITCPYASTSPAQEEEDSDLSIAHFLIHNFKWGEGKRLHYLWTGISLRPSMTNLPISNISTSVTNHHSGISVPFRGLESPSSCSLPRELRSLALQQWLQHVKDITRWGCRTG